MSRTRQMIELFAPPIMREGRPEKFTVKGFTCPECHGNGWGWRQGFDDADVETRWWERVACPACGGTGEIDAEVTVTWKRKEDRK